MILGLLHIDLHQQGTVRSICHLASTVITVAPVNNAHYAVAKTTHRKKSGKVIQEVNKLLFFKNKTHLT